MYKKSNNASIKRYKEKHYDRISVLVAKGEREKYKKFAESQGKSLNALIIESLEEKISRD